MANYMFVLRPTKETLKTVCPECAKRGQVVNNCSICHGCAIQKHSILQYYVQDRPVQITRIDRDPKTGVLRYWEGACDFFYETVYPELNKYVPEVPHGVHLCHDDMLSAKCECERINEYLAKNYKKDKTQRCATVILNC